MTVTLEQAVWGGYNTNPSIAVAPAVGDVVVAHICLIGQHTVSNVSGMGATWAQVARHPGSTNATGAATHEVWVGTGATSTGAITVTASTADRNTFGFLVRGTDGVVTSPATVADTASGDVTVIGPSGQGGVDQLVLDVASSYNKTFTWPSSTVEPATGWTFGTVQGGVWEYHKEAYAHRAPSADETHQTSMFVASAPIDGDKRITRILVGSAAPPAPTGPYLAEWDGATLTTLGLVEWDGTATTPLALSEQT